MGFPDPVRRVRGRWGCRCCIEGISEAYWRTLSTVINRDVGLRGVWGLCGRGSCTYSISQYPFLSWLARENFPYQDGRTLLRSCRANVRHGQPLYLFVEMLREFVAGPLAGLRHN